MRLIDSGVGGRGGGGSDSQNTDKVNYGYYCIQLSTKETTGYRRTNVGIQCLEHPSLHMYQTI